MNYEIIVRYTRFNDKHPFVWKLQRKTYPLTTARKIVKNYINRNTVAMVRPQGWFMEAQK